MRILRVPPPKSGVLHPLLHLGGGGRNKLIRIIYNEKNALHITIGGGASYYLLRGGGLHLEDVFLQKNLSQKNRKGCPLRQGISRYFLNPGGGISNLRKKLKVVFHRILTDPGGE